MADHFGYFSQTSCGFTRKGVHKRPQMYPVNEDGCFKRYVKSIAYMLGCLLAYPFVLAFTSIILGPYIMQRRVESTCAKIWMGILGFLLGLLFTPIFIAGAVLWTLFWVVMEIGDLCGCQDCDCFSMNDGRAFYG